MIHPEPHPCHPYHKPDTNTYYQKLNSLPLAPDFINSKSDARMWVKNHICTFISIHFNICMWSHVYINKHWSIRGKSCLMIRREVKRPNMKELYRQRINKDNVWIQHMYGFVTSATMVEHHDSENWHLLCISSGGNWLY